MEYTSQALIEAFLGRSLSANEIVILPYAAEAAEGYINDQIHTSFGDSTAPSTRYYDGGSRILEIDPCTDITKVELIDVDETSLHEFTKDEDYEARPRNESLKTWIEKRVGKFRRGVANVAVSATFSRGSSVPKDIAWLATFLTARLFGKDIKEGMKSESIEGYSRQFADIIEHDSQAQLVLNKYIQDEVLI